MNQQERQVQAIFGVCAEDALMEVAGAAALKVSGAQFAGGFRDYITADRRPQFSAVLRNALSCVALVDFDQDCELALETVDRLQQIFLHRISIVGVGSNLDAGMLLRAVRNGCTEFLTKPVAMEELASALNRFRSVRAIDPHAPSSIGRVVAFFGSKGGVGTTMLAVHLATHLVRQHGKKVLLIDQKPQLGHVALYLGLKDTQYHFDELLRNADRLDTELLEGFLIRHPSGLDVIASPEIASGPHEAKPEEMTSVMEFLRREYDYVLIDGPSALQHARASVVDQADEIYIVSTPDVAALRDLARLVEGLSVSESAITKLRVVVNRSAATDSITPEQIKKLVRLPISVAVPDNYFELLRAINDGEPVAPQRRSDFNQALAKWANRLAGGMAAPENGTAKKGLLSFLR
jgi:pilus assembly protein CpaE